MKKSIIIIIIIGTVIAGGVPTFVLRKDESTLAQGTQTATAVLTPAQEQGQPARSAEIKGIVKSIEGNELLIANEIDTVELTPEEQAAKKAERQAMSQEERQALKAQETATAEIENINIIIPVGVPIKKTTGDATSTLVASEIAEIKEGAYVSIWVDGYKTDSQTVVFTKLKATTN